MRKISVCIITKNESEKLKKCLKHLTVYGFEIVVVDTGSTDDTYFMYQIGKSYYMAETSDRHWNIIGNAEIMQKHRRESGK